MNYSVAQVGDDREKSQSPEDLRVKAKGRWAQRVDNKGILAQVDGRKFELGADGGKYPILINPFTSIYSFSSIQNYGWMGPL